MTAEIKLKIASWEHESMQPAGLRYALFCTPTEDEEAKGLRCLGNTNPARHLGNFPNYPAARTDGLAHPHAVRITFFPGGARPNIEKDFIKDFLDEALSQRPLVSSFI